LEALGAQCVLDAQRETEGVHATLFFREVLWALELTSKRRICGGGVGEHRKGLLHGKSVERHGKGRGRCSSRVLIYPIFVAAHGGKQCLSVSVPV